MGHATVSVFVLRGLILEKICELLFRWDKRNRPLYPGVRIKWVSVEWGTTIERGSWSRLDTFGTNKIATCMHF